MMTTRTLAADPNLADIAACNEEAAAKTAPSASPRAPVPSPPPRAGGEKSDPTGSIVTDSADPLAKGMDAQRAGDPAYRTAYRNCMKSRGERSR
jgi:hypothetical protein